MRSSEVLRRHLSMPSIVQTPYKSFEMLKEKLVAWLVFQFHFLMMTDMILVGFVRAIARVGVM